MAIGLTRRGLLIGALFAPAVVRAASIMPVANPNLVSGFYREYYPEFGRGLYFPHGRVFIPTFENGARSLRYETVWLHNSHPDAMEAFHGERQLQILRGRLKEHDDDAEEARVKLAARQQAWLSNPANSRRLANFYGQDELTPELGALVLA